MSKLNNLSLFEEHIVSIQKSIDIALYGGNLRKIMLILKMRIRTRLIRICVWYKWSRKAQAKAFYPPERNGNYAMSIIKEILETREEEHLKNNVHHITCNYPHADSAQISEFIFVALLHRYFVEPGKKIHKRTFFFYLEVSPSFSR